VRRSGKSAIVAEKIIVKGSKIRGIERMLKTLAKSLSNFSNELERFL